MSELFKKVLILEAFKCLSEIFLAHFHSQYLHHIHIQRAQLTQSSLCTVHIFNVVVCGKLSGKCTV